MSAGGEARLWLAQRVTAVFLAFFVVVHLATIIYAVRGGLAAEGILSRTRGSVAIAIFYGAFVIAAAVHGGIGLRTIFVEWLRLRRPVAGVAALIVAALLIALGMRAVVAVVAA